MELEMQLAAGRGTEWEPSMGRGTEWEPSMELDTELAVESVAKTGPPMESEMHLAWAPLVAQRAQASQGNPQQQYSYRCTK